MLTFECKSMDGVREIVTVTILSEVGDKLIDVARIGLERPARRQVNVSDNFVYSDPS